MNEMEMNNRDYHNYRDDYRDYRDSYRDYRDDDYRDSYRDNYRRRDYDRRGGKINNRSYRNYLPQEKVRSEIETNKGTQFDPEIAECMLSIIDDDKDYTLHE